MKALVVGGTGPTGPHIISGLQERGYDVTIFHRGTHEPPDLPDVRHLHGDPHFRETIGETIGSEYFNLVVAAYGRIGLLAEVLAERCQQLIAIGGVPAYAGWNEPDLVRPSGLRIPTREDSPLVDTVSAEGRSSVAFAQKILQSEKDVLKFHPRATIFRYPVIYGPRNPIPWEWSVIKRVRDGRRHMILPDDGLNIHQRCAARNAAEFLLRAVDYPDHAAGQRFNVADQGQWTMRQWAELILERLGRTLEFVSIPSDVAIEASAALSPISSPMSSHSIFAVEKAEKLLGYKDVVSPKDALDELVDWYLANPPVDFQWNPGYMDRFDYAAEDRLIEAYRGLREGILREVPQNRPEGLHGMPHPKSPSLAMDERGR